MGGGWWKIFMARRWIVRDRGNGDTVGWRSTSIVCTPRRDSAMDAHCPTGPPPTISTATRVPLALLLGPVIVRLKS